MAVRVSGGESGGAYTLIECSAGQGFGTPRHLHEHEDEAFYLLDGEMRVVCGTKEWNASPGTFVFLPRGIEHALLVTSEMLMRGLQITNNSDDAPNHDGLPAPKTPDVARMDEVGRRTGRIGAEPPLTREGLSRARRISPSASHRWARSPRPPHWIHRGLAPS